MGGGEGGAEGEGEEGVHVCLILGCTTFTTFASGENQNQFGRLRDLLKGRDVSLSFLWCRKVPVAAGAAEPLERLAGREHPAALAASFGPPTPVQLPVHVTTSLP